MVEQSLDIAWVESNPQEVGRGLGCEVSATRTLSSWRNEGFGPDVGRSGWHTSVYYLFQHGMQVLCVETRYFNKMYKSLHTITELRYRIKQYPDMSFKRINLLKQSVG